MPAKSLIIDTHCHIDYFIKNNNLASFLKASSEVGVEKIIAIGTHPEDWQVIAEASQQFPQNLHYTAGVHPSYIAEDWQTQLDLLAKHLESGASPCAIGEIGLDNYRLPEDPSEAKQVQEIQRKVFSAQLEIAAQENLPVVVHSRSAFEDCIEVISASRVSWEKVVFHCFAEGANEIRRLNELGGRGSFTGIITYKKADSVREALKAQGLERLMLETDAPYLAPVPFRGKANHPQYLPATAQCAAEILGISHEDVCKSTTVNALAFFGLE